MNEMNLTNLSFTDSGCESDVDEEEYMCYVGNIVEVPLEVNDRLRSLPHAELIEHLTAELRHDIVSQVPRTTDRHQPDNDSSPLPSNRLPAVRQPRHRTRPDGTAEGYPSYGRRFVEQWKNTDHFPRPLGIWQLENSFGDSSCQGDRYFLITAKQCSQVNLVNVSTGELVAEYGRDFLHSPHGLLVDRNNRLVVVDTGRQKIFWYDLERCVKIGQSGMVLKPACKLKNPLFVAMDSRNRLHVSNCSESRICMFDLNRFNFVGKYGDEVLDRAPPAPSIYSSVGIAVDLADRSYVVDWMQHRIVIFGPQGEPLGMVDPFVSKLRSPQGIAAFGDGLVAVADAGSHCVKIYSCNDDDEQ
ncbi:Tripartite motif-containing protein [Trichinella spiralis]|uniref:Tripartite motif-containing protein n=1 Tax=Trichinella spiralis TaxID=6334 RepID=A0ABR3K9I2_TRISP